MRVEDVSEVCDDFVTALVQDALAGAEHDPDGFAPFGAVLNMDGTQWRIPDPASHDLETALDLARFELARVSESARCVALVWGGDIQLHADREAVYAHLYGGVYVEVYELGRSVGHIVAMGYRRSRRGVSATGQTAENTLTSPIVPLTIELVRRHLGEWAEDCREDLRLFVQQLDADIRGFDRLDDDMRAFDVDSRACGPLFDEWLSTFPFGELDRDDAIALLAPAAQYVAEVLISVHGGRWDVVVDGEQFSHVVVVDGDDGRIHQVDPYAVVAEYADAPLPPLSAFLQHAEDLVHR